MSERIQSSFAGRFAPLGFLCSVEAFFVFLILNEWVPDALWRMEDKIAIAVGGGIVLLYILALRVYKAVARRSCLILSQFVLLAITLWALLAKGCEVAYPIVFFLLVFWQFFIFFTSYRGVLSESFSGKELMSAHGFSLALFCFFFAFNPIFLDKPISSGNYFLIVPAALAFIYSFCIRVPAIGSEHERREGSKGIFRAPHGKEGSYLLVAESMVYVWLCLFLMLWQGAGSNVHTPYFVGGLCAGSFLVAVFSKEGRVRSFCFLTLLLAGGMLIWGAYARPEMGKNFSHGLWIGLLAGGFFGAVLTYLKGLQGRFSLPVRESWAQTFRVLLFAGILVDCFLARKFLFMEYKLQNSTLILIFTVAFLVLFLIALPKYFLRFLTTVIMGIFFRVRLRGGENLPKSGPVLIVANHASFADMLLILSTTERLVRFPMRAAFYDNIFLHPFARWGKAIRLPASASVSQTKAFLETVRKLLKAGECVCIFPEGEITYNGVMGSFRASVEHYLPADMKVPVIPLYIGHAWGSLFSRYTTNRGAFSRKYPHFVSLNYGEPIPKDSSKFALRQRIAELGADAEKEPHPSDRPLHYQMAKNARLHPFRKLLCDYEGKEFTCFQTCVASAIFSRKIRQLAGESHYVGVLLPNCSASALCVCGVLMADKVPAMLNFTASNEAMQYAIKKADLKLILTSRKFLAKLNKEPLPQMVFLEDIAASVGKLEKLGMALAVALLPHQELMNLLSPKSHRDVMQTACLLFSSGSTGIPKGVMLSHHNFNSDIHSFLSVMGFQSSDVMLGSLPLFHAFGMNTAFWLPVMVGCKVVYIPNPLDCDSVGKAAEKHKATILLATPTFLQAYMRKCPPERFRFVRLAISGAEKLRKDISEKFDAENAAKIVLIEGYGCTELAPIAAINIGETFENLGKIRGKEGSIGPALPGLCARIVDPVTREELAPNEEGLLEIKGPNVMQGYLGEDAQTRDVIRQGWYNTGDIGKMDEKGYITLCGRYSRFSKIGGEMVPHELVECAINERIGADSKLAVVASIQDAAKGEALLVLHTALPIGVDEIITSLRSTLPNLWVPKAGNFVQVDEIPILGSGKLDLAKLRQMALDVAEKRKSGV